MKFGKVEHPELIDFTLPPTHLDTPNVLSRYKQEENKLNVYVGCAKWNKTDLKGFYPKGTKDELEYYSSQFNSIELNATFYRQFPPEQFDKWRVKTPDNFKFFPKITQEISHWKRLEGVADAVNYYLDAVSHLENKLGTIFLQLHNNFSPKNFDRLQNFVLSWPKGIPLSVECRHTDWFTNPSVSSEFYQLLEENNICNTLVDTAGRRDMLHMRLTNNEAFIRYVGANHPSDYQRLDEWVIRLKEWVNMGLKNIHFFVHQNLEVESPLLAAYFIQSLNKELEVDLKIPNDTSQQSLF
ncbi:DUF72 domain-containing protein [Tenacibaculum sp. IB213877]|uniref:DUF72 domain-containing protein n=1 Tax=Tenacibaculum sp. IB213877 TaxID=3097351 RepID=UPI002A5AEE84|nr:DUF72 domain-containing protein [Tenacibaculum sp. IB213877]MDY0779674.1 DUF72 domain-containing protein [Tenacibaculum sp. IB213877]